MKGVCAPGMHPDATCREGGRSDAVPYLYPASFQRGMRMVLRCLFYHHCKNRSQFFKNER